jgi:hypothetical protein
MSKLHVDYFTNNGGLNVTDSPFTIADSSATGGFNYDYILSGSISRSRGRTAINTIADAQAKTLGLFPLNTSTGTQTVVRCAGTKIQTLNTDTGATTNQAEDTATASSTFLDATSTQPVVSATFNTPSANLLFMAGGGMSSIYAYTGTKVTQNGVPAPTGIFSVSVGGTGGTWSATGTYYASLVLRKASTQALSNAALDIQVAITATTQKATFTFPTGIDTTKYDQWYIYLSAVAGASGFTAGTLVAQVSTATPTYLFDGSTVIASAQVVPRAGATTDNSVLPTGTYKCLTAFKRRLVTAKGSTFYLSDLDKPESWPTANSITIPTGGNITGVAVIGFNAPITGNTDEYLVIFKQTETWVLTGDSAADWVLKFASPVGCATQALCVPAQGYLTWVDYHGVYLWTGSGKPIYISRPLEALFAADGDINRSLLGIGWGVYYKKQNQIIWHLSHRTLGENVLQLKLDLKHTSLRVGADLQDLIADGVFSLGYNTAATGVANSANLYAGCAYATTSNDELMLAGDAAGYVYTMFKGYTDAGLGNSFSYETKWFDFGVKSVAKQVTKVIAWVDEITSNSLVMQYWSDYKPSPTDRSQISQSMGDPKGAISAALWDAAYWDVSSWDDYTPKRKALVFNLSGEKNNNQGDSFKFKFTQSDANCPVVIHGFTVFYDNLGVRR